MHVRDRMSCRKLTCDISTRAARDGIPRKRRIEMKLGAEILILSN